MKFELIPEWRKPLQFISAQCLAGVISLQAMLMGFPPEWLAVRLPFTPFTMGQVLVACGGAVAVLGFVGRFLKQKEPAKPAEPAEPVVTVIDGAPQ